MKKRIVFGTDGIRGNADQWPFLNQTIYALGRAFARWAMQKNNTDTLKVMIGSDTRASVERIKQMLFLGIERESPVAQLIDCHVIPTPALALIAKKKPDVHGSIMISASHNPFYDNGIKMFNNQGEKIAQSDEEQIAVFFSMIAEEEPLLHELRIKNYAWHNEYLSWLKTECLSAFVYPKKVVIDCAHGATVALAEAAFKPFVGELIVINAAPTGKNINENAGALCLDSLVCKVLEEEASIGFAFDGDGDRVIAVDSHGVVRDGDDILALLLLHPDYNKELSVVGTVMSNSGFESWLQKHNKKLFRTPVGDKYVAAAMIKDGLLLGGEPSGHIIVSNHTKTGDGILVALKVLETMVLAGAAFESSFDRFVQVHEALSVSQKIPLEELSCYSSLELIHKSIHPGRIIIRYSGTEPVLRVMVEHAHQEEAHKLSKEVVQLLQKALL
jgi:phosphoglucosamine mutase